MARDKMQTLADELEEVMEQIEEVACAMQPLQQREQEIRTELTEGLLKKGYKYIKTTSGLGFGIVAGRVSHAIKKFPGSREKAVQWAQEHYPAILSISGADLNKVAIHLAELPSFIERKEGQPHLSVRTTEENED